MAELRDNDRCGANRHLPAPAWSQYCARAIQALRRHFLSCPALSPAAVARTVTAVLPASRGAALFRRLEQLGWLAPEAVLPFDLLDNPACPARFAEGERALVRLAVFGLPGQGLSSRDKRRQDVYQQLSAQVMSGAVDTASLRAITTRVMNHPDVAADPVLNSMLRSFIVQREAALRAHPTPAEEQFQKEHASKLTQGFDVPRASDFPTREELLQSFARLQREFDGFLAQFEETRARRTLDKMRELRQRFPVHVPANELQHCDEQYDRLLKRAGAYRRQISDLAAKGSQVAREGDETTAAWVIRRLQAIHTLLPNLLSEQRLAELRDEISRCGQEHETQEAARELVERQREVGAKIKNLAGVIHRFHELAEKLPPEDNAYRRAELNYRRAVEEIRELDTDWLSSLVIQLETFLDDLEDPTDKMQNQLDQFIARVRTALNRLCLEIRAHQKKSKKNPRRDPPPARSEGDTPPRPT